MPNRLFTALFLTVSIPAFCQVAPIRSGTVLPVFEKTADSLTYASLQEQLYNGYAEGAKKNTIDSLTTLSLAFWGKAIRYTTVYFPKFARWDTLAPSHRGQVTQLSIYGLKSRKLPREILACTQLEELELVNTSVTVIRKMKRLKRLQHLAIFNNQQDHPLIVRRNPGIKQLLIRSDRPGGLPRSYRKLKHLQRLDLNRTGAVRFPDIYHNKKLEFLYLAGNQITLADLHDKKHRSLQAIDLRSNAITIVPDAIGNFPSLLGLSLNNNAITTVKSGARWLTKLEYITLYNNQLETIPPVLFELKMLRNVDLYYNHLKRVDDGILEWRGLQELHVGHNLINHLPDSIGKLIHLRGLFVHNNHLTQLPASAANLTQLRELRFGSNYFTEFPAVIGQLPNLTWLDVSNNELTRLPEELFRRKNLEILSLYGNRWDEAMQKQLPQWIEWLRAQRTKVLTSPPEEDID